MKPKKQTRFFLYIYTHKNLKFFLSKNPIKKPQVTSTRTNVYCFLIQQNTKQKSYKSNSLIFEAEKTNKIFFYIYTHKNLNFFSIKNPYQKTTGNQYKNKRVLMEHIFHQKALDARQNMLAEQAAVRRDKDKARRTRRAEKVAEKQGF